jgi:competence protein ComEC
VRYWTSWVAAGLAAALLGGFVGSRQDGETELVFISVGQGDCAVFEHDGEAILIDDGPGVPEADAGTKIVVPRLRQLGVDTVDAIFLSHPDGDHVGGTPAVIHAYPEARLVMSDQYRDDPAMAHHLSQWGVPASQVCWLPHDDSLRFGGFSARIVCPDMEPGDPENNGSMFVHLAYKDATAMFSGDAPASVEKAMEPLGGWNAEILKVGHHGSRTATDESWVEAVRPRFAVISVGRNNRYGHPNQEVLDRLAADHVPTFRTDRDGDVRFVFDGEKFVLAPSG